MNREQIENMPAGREMDALIAKEVMGLEVLDVPIVPREVFNRHWLTDAARREFMKAYPDGGAKTISHYSTDISVAWMVVEKMREKSGVVLSDFLNNDWSCHFVDAGKEIVAETLPLAICRAALLAVSS